MPSKHDTTLQALPETGFVFWPVGTGDSTSLCVDKDTIVQVDLHQVSDAEDDDNPHAAIVQELVELLPKRDGKPYLAVFALTHPDQDHCRGFSELLDKVQIGELWFTPRVFREYKKDLCDDAVTFHNEARRRLKATIKAGRQPSSGDRVRIVGYDDLLEEDDFKGFPEELLTIPGEEITKLDGEDVSDSFRAFIHAPFKDDSYGERNDASLAMQVTLEIAGAKGSALLFGDLCYPTIRRIFDKSAEDDLIWNVMLAAHHCSKSVMYWADGDEEESLRNDILEDMEKAAGNPGYIVASSGPIPSSNKKGDNPPHAKAKNRYLEIVPNQFLCTQEYPDEEDPSPIVFEFDDGGFHLIGEDGGNGDSDRGKGGGSLSGAVAAARGGSGPPKERVGFGFAT